MTPSAVSPICRERQTYSVDVSGEASGPGVLSVDGCAGVGTGCSEGLGAAVSVGCDVTTSDDDTGALDASLGDTDETIEDLTTYQPPTEYEFCAQTHISSALTLLLPWLLAPMPV